MILYFEVEKILHNPYYLYS